MKLKDCVGEVRDSKLKALYREEIKGLERTEYSRVARIFFCRTDAS